MIFRQQISDVAPAEVPVNLIQCDHFSGIVFQYAHGNLDLVAVFLARTLLGFHVNLHPVQQISLVLTEYDSCLIAGQFDNTFRLDGIGGIHGRLILPTGIVVRFRNEIQLEIFVCSFSETVYIKIQTLASICQLLCPKADRLFYFCRLLYSWHIDPFIILFLLQRYE